MNRNEKEAFVSNLSNDLKDVQAFAFLSFTKLNVEQMTSFRLSLSKKDIRVKVVKNTLARKIFNDSPYKEVLPHIIGPTMLVYSAKDPIETTKTIWEWAEKENFGIKVKGGAALGQTMSEAQLKSLSKLPGRKELFTGFLWALNSHQTSVLYALQDAQKKVLYGATALKAKKESETAGT